MYRFYSNNTPRSVIVAQHSEGVLNLAVSRCSKKDRFIRKRGRAIAEGRLNKGMFYKTIKTGPDFKTKDFVEIAKTVATELETNLNVCGGGC